MSQTVLNKKKVLKDLDFEEFLEEIHKNDQELVALEEKDIELTGEKAPGKLLEISKKRTEEWGVCRYMNKKETKKLSKTEKEILKYLQNLMLDRSLFTINKEHEELTDLVIEAFYGNDAWRGFRYHDNYKGNSLAVRNCKGTVLMGKGQIKMTLKKVIETGLEGKITRKPKKEQIEIARKAFLQNKIPISKKLPSSEKSLLILLLTSPIQDQIEKYKVSINKRFTLLLKSFIPRYLNMAFKRNSKVFRPFPGFLYRASEEFGAGHLFWATPNIVSYWGADINIQNDVLTKVAPNKRNSLSNLDVAVKRYYNLVNKKSEMEISIASKLFLNNINTYKKLLNYNPTWFTTIFNYLYK